MLITITIQTSISANRYMYNQFVRKQSCFTLICYDIKKSNDIEAIPVLTNKRSKHIIAHVLTIILNNCIVEGI